MTFSALSREHLVPQPLPEISIYIHIPFCRTRCHYCAFYLETGFSPRVLNETLEGITAEAYEWARRLEYPRIRTVYVGGGTPSVIPASRLRSFLLELRSAFRMNETGEPVEWTVEVNPESVDRDLLSALEDSGVDRISLGIQSLHDNELAVLGRRSDSTCARNALRLIAEQWRHRLSTDVIVGTPGQYQENLKLQLDELLGYGVAHVSCYGLTVEPGTALAQSVSRGALRMPDRDLHEALWETTTRTLKAAGFRAYEVSNYAKPGHESIHNYAYWRLDPYLGLGPGAVSTIPVTGAGGSGGGGRSGAGGRHAGAAGAGDPGESWTAAGAGAPREGRHHGDPAASQGEGSGGGAPREGDRLVATASKTHPRPARLTGGSIFTYQSIRKGELAHDLELLSSTEFLFEHFMNGLRTTKGVSMETIRARFSYDGAPIDTDALTSYLQREWPGYRLRDARSNPRTRLVLGTYARETLDTLLPSLLQAIEAWVAPETLTTHWPERVTE